MNTVELLVAALHTQADPAAWFAQAEAARADWDDLAVTALKAGISDRDLAILRETACAFAQGKTPV